MAAPSIRGTVDALLEATDGATLRQLLLSHPDALLSEEACALLAAAEVAHVSSKGPLTTGLLLWLLQHGRSEGMFPVLNFVDPIPEDVLQAVSRYLNAGNWHHMFAELEKNWFLLTGEHADACLHDFLVAYRDDRTAGQRVNAALRLVEIGRNNGPANARQWLLAQLSGQFGTTPDAAIALLALQPPTSAEWAELLELHLKSIKALPDPFTVLEETLQVLNCLPPEPPGGMPPSVRVAVELAKADLYLFRRQGDREQNRALALLIVQKALGAAKLTGHPDTIARAHLLLAKAWSQRQTDRAAALRSAIGHLDQASAVPTSGNTPGGSAELAELLGSCLRRLAARTPDSEERNALLVRAEATLSRAIGDRAQTGSLRLQMELALALDALAEFEPSRGPVAVEMAHRVARSTDVTTPFTRAYYQCRYGEIAIARHRAGDAVELSPLVEIMSEAETIFKRLALLQETAWAAELIGDVQMIMGRWDEALVKYQTVMTAGDDLFARSFTVLGKEVAGQSQSAAAAKIGFCLCKSGRPGEAMLNFENSKLRIVLGILRREHLAAADVPAVMRRTIAQALEVLRDLEVEARRPADQNRRSDAEIGEAMRQATERLDRLEAEVRSAGGMADAPELTTAIALAAVPPGGVALLPLVTPVGTALVVLRSGVDAILTEDVRYLPLTSEDLKRLVSRYALFIETRRVSTVEAGPLLDAIVGELWGLLMGAITTIVGDLGLAHAAPVMLVSQSGLAVLPLAAAADPAGHGMPFLADFDLTCVPSLSLIADLGRRERGVPPLDTRMVAVIDPSENLTFARLEGALIGAIAGAPDLTKVVGARATKSRVVASMSTATHLHFACHGSFRLDDPWSSGLVMADGRLQASQIAFEAPPRTLTLVVLSACETGISGFKEAPDEFLGLPAAFLISGAHAVVSSLWSVNDASSALLITEFYRLHLDERQGVRSALRNAQLWLRSATTADLQLWLAAFERSCDWWSRAGWSTRLRLRRLRNGLRKYGPDTVPFAAAGNWAAFVALTAARQPSGV